MTSMAALPPRARRRARLGLASVAAAGVAALAWAAFTSPRPRLFYNPSDSVAVGWYRIQAPVRRADALPVGSIVLARLPVVAAALAAQRGYLPAGVPLLKRVGAVAPQRVCVVGREVRIDGEPVAAALGTDRLRRPLRAWRGCRRLRAGELFLLSTANAASFDSRYFGPIHVGDVLGIAHGLWPETPP